jgi:hypothetical protein
MKKTLLFITSILTFNAIGFAQIDTNKIVNTSENYNEFFKMSQARLIGNISKAKTILEKEGSRIQALNNLDDSLLAKGDITDSTSKVYKAKLSTYKFENDSLLKKANEFDGKIKSLKSVKNNFLTILKTVPVFSKAIETNEYATYAKLKDVEVELSKSNLGAEKKQLKEILGNADVQQKKDIKALDGLGDTKAKGLVTGKIDSATAQSADTRISNYLKKIEENAAEIKTLEKRIGTPEDYAANSASIKSRVLLLDSEVNKSAAARKYSFDMIEESLSKSTKTLFSLAAFFGPGGYAIPEEKLEKARIYFSPVIDSLIKFSNKYAEAPRTATIIVNGYADATQISKGSKLYNELAASLKVDEPTKEQLNIRLSALRAEELSKLFTKTIEAKSGKFIALPKITFENLEVGRGEQLPDPTIKNYKVNDERRRIVIVYWSVLPNQ